MGGRISPTRAGVGHGRVMLANLPAVDSAPTRYAGTRPTGVADQKAGATFDFAQSTRTEGSPAVAGSDGRGGRRLAEARHRGQKGDGAERLDEVSGGLQ